MFNYIDFISPISAPFNMDDFFNTKPNPLDDNFEEKPMPVYVAKTDTKINIEKNVDMKLADADETRVWEVSGHVPSFGGYTVSVAMKNRVEKPTALVPELMYSSIQCQIPVTILEPEYTPNNFPFLMGKVFVVDSETGQKLNTDLKGRKPVSGTTDAAMTRVNGEALVLKGLFKIRFGDLTFHKVEKHYRILIEFYMPNDLGSVMLAVTTPVFRVYSRKPNKKKAPKKGKAKTRGRKKRKRKIDKVVWDENDIIQPYETKRRKKTKEDDGFNLQVFNKKLDDLVKLSENFDTETKKEALKLLMDRFNGEF